ncbi:3'-5' exonuclease [Nocardia higoensis]|uniref:3'-5' exonuclease n=1 Tax=Nocardia higoensis TaxID=228599 RepID=A0ABS0DG60_9NOCA|nr:3'-5' exonuclease [Nocardia higoensis]MBF6357409.1 3'-5' exonuclease [Nocardia higoensis]
MIVPVPLRGREFAVVDVEGNGQTPPEIIEIAILPVSRDDVVVQEMRSWLIRPVRPITPVVTRTVHGITNGDVDGKPTWAEVSEQISGALTDRILVAHNANVERRVLSEHLPGWAPPMVLDTLRLAKAVWPGLAVATRWRGWSPTHVSTETVSRTRGLIAPDGTRGRPGNCWFA